MKALLAALLVVATTACVAVATAPALPKAGPDVVLCHKNKKTMTVPHEAADAHIKHGDHYGPC